MMNLNMLSQLKQIHRRVIVARHLTEIFTITGECKVPFSKGTAKLLLVKCIITVNYCELTTNIKKEIANFDSSAI